MEIQLACLDAVDVGNCSSEPSTALFTHTSSDRKKRLNVSRKKLSAFFRFGKFLECLWPLASRAISFFVVSTLHNDVNVTATLGFACGMMEWLRTMNSKRFRWEIQAFISLWRNRKTTRTSRYLLSGLKF